MKKTNKSNGVSEFDYYFSIGQDPQPKQLWYLAASLAVIMAAFLTLILI